MKILNFFKLGKKAEGKSYFDLSAKEKKEIIKKAAKEANQMQQDLIKRYDNLIAA